MASNGKIDSLYDFTPKGLRELESWLEPWIKGQLKGIDQKFPGAAINGHVIQDEGSAVTQRARLNFIGDDIAVTDDPVNNRTNVTAVWGFHLWDDSVLSVPFGVVDYAVIHDDSAAFLFVETVFGTGSGINQNQIRFSGDSAAHYHWVQSYADANVATAVWDGNLLQSIGRVSPLPPATADTLVPAVGTVLIHNYWDTTMRKTYLANWGVFNTAARVGSTYGSWNQTGSITRIERVASVGAFATGSRFSFYGLRKNPHAL